MQLPSLMYETSRERLPRVPAALLAADSGSPTPAYPEIVGEPRQGDTAQRRAAVERHATALARAFAQAPPDAKTILIVGHGATTDFVCGALREDAHPAALHSGAGPDGEPQMTPPHCSITASGFRPSKEDPKEPQVATTLASPSTTLAPNPRRQRLTIVDGRCGTTDQMLLSRCSSRRFCFSGVSILQECSAGRAKATR
jgi:hypothetical protein